MSLMSTFTVCSVLSQGKFRADRPITCLGSPEAHPLRITHPGECSGRTIFQSVLSIPLRLPASEGGPEVPAL
eukprot:7754101-Pyramimonas_sp.AAC.1